MERLPPSSSPSPPPPPPAAPPPAPVLVPMSVAAPPKPKRSPCIYSQRQQAPTNFFIYEPLPTAPPDLCGDGNIFKFPPVIRNTKIASSSSTGNLHSPVVDDDELAKLCQDVPSDKNHCCAFCRPYREDRETIEPLKSRLKSAIDAMDQLNHSYALLDKLLEQKLAIIDDSDEQEQEKDEQCASSAAVMPKTCHRAAIQSATDTEFELEHSLTFLESIFGTEIVPIFKQGAFKRMRERSKSMMEDEIHILNKERTQKLGSTFSTRPYLLRRQSTYSDNKSKVSKWTKVKAAFKWERANVPPAIANEGFGLTPVNHEVARYLKVPANPCGGSSSADSVISGSSSGHFLSDTPGTISSASSMDDIEASCRHAVRRDSSKSDARCDSRTSVDYEVAACELSKSPTDESAKQTAPSKSASNKSIRRSKVFTDFEVLPEDHVADIKSTSNRRNKLPPSPLNLNQDFNDSLNLHSPMSLKSPKDGSLSRTKRMYSSGNSSVPSSPSRHSDFFAEFESEDISSGDFSEPTTPNRNSCLQGQDEEVFQRYRLLLFKLDLEFKAKQREYERSAGNRNAVPGAVLRGNVKKSDEHSPTQVYNNDLVSTELLEENLTPEFKKKLHKWRIKKQNSLMCVPYHHSQHSSQGTPQAMECAPSPSAKNIHSAEATKPKFDWNLWSTGQVKLEGQGLCALPDQKDLPEKFQKKLEQWNKIKCGGAVSDNDSLKRTSKHSQSTRRGSDDDRWYKHKPHEREKLAKLKAIVAPDHQTKNIEVQTASGVMKFEGISRKFTRKLYEWEKARGIGPEASTFALLHPGYCPIDVRRINKESRNAGDENSPTLSRSLSLDSMTPNVTLPVITQQASSLSLNNVNELKSTEESADALTDHEFKKDDELEAVMVEVEEHIDDTASPLITAHSLVEQQTPIYKYEEVQCNDYCNTRRVQSFESHTNLAPLLSVLKRADDLFDNLRKASPDIMENSELRSCQMILSSIRSIYPYFSNNLMKANVLNAISDVQNELGRLTELSQKSPLDEACCQEILEERNYEYNEEFRGLLESLECLKTGIQGGLPKEIVPDINVVSEDGHESSIYAPSDYACRMQLPTTLEAYDEHSGSHKENETESTATTTYRAPTNPNATPSGNVTKKKLRLRKMGSRQNSKTESDSSDEEAQSILETPRRLRRQKFRLKQRSLDDDFRLRSDEQAAQPPTLPISSFTTSENVLYTLKVKPGQLIEQTQTVNDSQKVTKPLEETSKVTAFVPPPLPERHTLSYNTNANVFVKTKRKLFTTIVEPNATEGIALIEKVLDSPTLNEAVDEVTNADEVKKETSTVIPVKEPARRETPKFVMQKSISLDDVTPTMSCLGTKDEHALRKAQSSELTSKPTSSRKFDVPPPLAADSFRTINKSLVKEPAINKEVSVKAANSVARKEHLFKKHMLLKSPTATSAKIEHKIAKTNSASAVDGMPLRPPNRLDNTLPRIHRKLDGKTLTPTSTLKRFEFPVETPLQIAVDFIDEKPVTPISERALKLQRAKAEFLQGASPCTSAAQTPTSPMVFCMPTPPVEVTHNELWQNDAGVNLSNGNDEDMSTLQNCSSVSTINTPVFGTSASVGGGAGGGYASQQSDICTDQENSSIYENLPRSVTRSGKLSSKLGFATLASKLRRAKGGSKKKSKESGNDSGNGTALSALCRQTLMADVIALPQMIATSSGMASSSTSTGNVLKSQSSPHAATYRKTTSHEALNKSQSEQFVKYLVSKESDV